MDDSPGQDEKNIIDQVRLQDLANSLGDELQGVIEVYLEDTPRLIAEMQAAYEREDWNEVQRQAHSLKSSSGIFGAQELVGLARSLETTALEDHARAAEAVQVIPRAFEDVRAVLNLYLKTN